MTPAVSQVQRSDPLSNIRWPSHAADSRIWGHSQAARLYVEEVAHRALSEVDARIESLGRLGGLHLFLQDDFKSVRQATVQAFVLGIHSMWERQFRDLVIGCAGEQASAAKARNLQRADWKTLLKAFERCKGVGLEVFDSFSALDRLQVLANACRHGEGPASRDLFCMRPQYWPNWPLHDIEAMIAGREPRHGPHLRPPFSAAVIPDCVLAVAACAIKWFWEDFNWVCLSSGAAGTQPELMAILAAERDKRLGRDLSLLG